MNKFTPLSARMRPKTLDAFFGQTSLVGKNSFLREAIKNDNIPSMILWGPPGSGKTTLAWIIAEQTNSEFIEISAADSGIQKLKNVIEKSKINRRFNTKTIVFIDEIHKWNKLQQDKLLFHIENGNIILIGATTENPSFEINSALLSRTMVFVLKKLNTEDIIKILKNALKNKEKGFGIQNVKISPTTIKYIAEISNGDARIALNILEISAEHNKTITKKFIEKIVQKTILYDKKGEEHYNLISALHKSMRGGDVNASLYYLARMLEGGEDPLYIARRIIRFSSEDIGLANSLALQQAVSAYDACRFIGMPECSINLAQAVVYMAKSKKSTAIYEAYNKVILDIKKYGSLSVPLHIRNAPTKLMKDFEYGKGYKYTPKYKNKKEAEQEYMPKKLKNRKYIKFLNTK